MTARADKLEKYLSYGGKKKAIKSVVLTVQDQWYKAWHDMRILYSLNEQDGFAVKISRLGTMHWLAFMRLMSRDTPDPILSSPETNREVARIIDEILAEEKANSCNISAP